MSGSPRSCSVNFPFRCSSQTSSNITQIFATYNYLINAIVETQNLSWKAKIITNIMGRWSPLLSFTYWPGPYYCRCWDASKGSHTRLQSPGSCPPRPARWDSRTTRALRTHTPSSGRSTARPPPPWSWLGRGRLGALDRPEPRLRGGSLSFGNILRQQPAGAVKVYTSKVYC